MPARHAIAMTALLVMGCERGSAAPPPPDPAAAVIARPSPLRLHAGESRQLAAQANDAAGAPIGGAVLEYSSSTPALLKVSATGLVTSVGPAGTGAIEVTSGTASASVDVTVTAGAADTVSILSGDGQTARVGAVLPDPITVLADDVRGNPVAGAAVRFVTDAGGAAGPAEVTTDRDGVARTRWTLGSRAGSQTISASLSAVPESIVTASATATPGQSAKIERYGEPAALAVAGVAVAARVHVLDAFDNPVPGVSVSWSDDTGGTFDPATATTGAQGSATTQWLPRPALGERRAIAKSPALPDQTVEWVVTVRAGPAAAVEVVKGDGQRGAAGKPARVAPVVRVVDAHGNPVAGVAVAFAVTAGEGAVDAEPVVTDDAGAAVARGWVLAPGDNAVSATVAGVDAPATFNATGRGRR